MKTVIFTVTNDLSYDQRMSRICTALSNAHYHVLLIGRKRSASKPLPDKPYRQIRLRCFFNKGKLFYIEYNIRLFFFIFFQSFDILCGIDLDTILATFLIAKIKKKPLVYDAHEYFTELPEVVGRPFVKLIWKTLEKWIIPKIKHAYTINTSYAHMFKKDYNLDFEIIMNATVLRELPPKKINNNRYILYQGAVNIGRGVEEMIVAMQDIECKLFIYGKGDVYNKCVKLVNELHLNDKVTFFGYVSPEELHPVTANAWLGTTLFSNQGLSHYYSLANRFFDYMHAGVPQLAMNFPEYKRINETHEIALLLDNLLSTEIVTAVNKLLNNDRLYEKMQQNCLLARENYNWQKEQEKLIRFYSNIS